MKKKEEEKPVKKALSDLELKLIKEEDHLLDDHGNLIVGNRNKKPVQKK